MLHGGCQILIPSSINQKLNQRRFSRPECDLFLSSALNLHMFLSRKSCLLWCYDFRMQFPPMVSVHRLGINPSLPPTQALFNLLPSPPFSHVLQKQEDENMWKFKYDI